VLVLRTPVGGDWGKVRMPWDLTTPIERTESESRPQTSTHPLPTWVAAAINQGIGDYPKNHATT